jgi:hypothetical protein
MTISVEAASSSPKLGLIFIEDQAFEHVHIGAPKHFDMFRSGTSPKNIDPVLLGRHVM